MGEEEEERDRGTEGERVELSPLLTGCRCCGIVPSGGGAEEQSDTIM